MGVLHRWYWADVDLGQEEARSVQEGVWVGVSEEEGDDSVYLLGDDFVHVLSDGANVYLPHTLLRTQIILFAPISRSMHCLGTRGHHYCTMIDILAIAVLSGAVC